MTSPDNSRAVRATALGAGVAVSALLPLFLVGAMAVQIGEELAFGTVGLGVAAAVFRGAGAASSVHLGRSVDQRGATRSLRSAALIVAAGSIGVAVAARGLVTLLVFVAVCGAAAALAQPAANRMLLRQVPAHRLGTAFGIKQSAPPSASLVAGVAVPVVAVTVGWRWAFVAVGLAALVLAVSIRTPATTPGQRPGAAARTRQPLRDRRLLVLLTVGFALGNATSSISTTFLVDAQVAAGSAPTRAGLTLSAASGLAILTRLILGAVSDRLAGRHLLLCAGLLVLGAGGLWLLSTGDADGAMVVGGIFALVGCWGYNGVFWFALVRAYPDDPGRITGALSPGGLAGSTLGPVLFGTVVERMGYASAWRLTVPLALAAAITMALGAGRLDRR